MKTNAMQTPQIERMRHKGKIRQLHKDKRNSIRFRIPHKHARRAKGQGSPRTQHHQTPARQEDEMTNHHQMALESTQNPRKIDSSNHRIPDSSKKIQ